MSYVDQSIAYSGYISVEIMWLPGSCPLVVPYPRDAGWHKDWLEITELYLPEIA